MTNSAKLLVCIILFKILVASTQEDRIRIAGGYRPQKHTLIKHIVSITQKGYNIFGVKHFCGGSIIYPRWILTAAHCLWDRKLNKTVNPKELQIIAGTPNRLKKTEHTQVIDVMHVLLHPDYDDDLLINDIGAMVLETDIIFDDVYAQRIRLIDGPTKENQSCTVVGWGGLFDDGPMPAEALCVDVSIISREVCKIQYPNLTIEHICAGDPSDPEKSSCQGDSGGPLICDGKVAGVVSGGYGCRDYAIYANVWYFREKFLKKWLFGCQGRTTIRLLNILLLKLLVWIVI